MRFHTEVHSIHITSIVKKNSGYSKTQRNSLCLVISFYMEVLILEAEWKSLLHCYCTSEGMAATKQVAAFGKPS